MKANELMIGDWVKHSITGQMGKVYRICGNEYIAFIDGDTQSELVEPIPLTPEILEKNGFIRIKAAIITYKLTEYLYWTPRGLEHELSGIPICHLNFIHELQHTLKLCRSDKEITL